MKENQYDLALLDINLPDIDGVTLLKQLKNMAKEKQEPIKTIAVSAHVFNEDVTKFIESGFDSFVAKPVQMKKLKPSIAKVMFNVDGIDEQHIEKEQPDMHHINERITEEGCKLTQDKTSCIDTSHFDDFLLFDSDIPNQDIEYLGNVKVRGLVKLFCQQTCSEYNDFSKLSVSGQQDKLHKLKGAAIGLGLIRLYQVCQSLESHCQNELLNKEQLIMLDELIQRSIVKLNKYSQGL